MNSEEKRFYEYIVTFRNNPPLTIWAKQYDVFIKDGVTTHMFRETHSSSNIGYINPAEVLYVTVKDSRILLD